ncbi:MAG TPA: hypothetical protein ENI95_05030 [Chloroflexi bacterium]|nr:hypothetical protein [Chloroflexota bacterium]
MANRLTHRPPGQGSGYYYRRLILDDYRRHRIGSGLRFHHLLGLGRRSRRGSSYDPAVTLIVVLAIITFFFICSVLSVVAVRAVFRV